MQNAELKRGTFVGRGDPTRRKPRRGGLRPSVRPTKDAIISAFSFLIYTKGGTTLKFRMILAAIFAVCLILMLAACSNNSPLTGKYVIADIADDPDGTTFAQLDEMYKEMELDIADYVYFEFTDTGRFTLVMFGKTEAQGGYRRGGKTLTLTAGGADEVMTAEISGNKITWTYEGGATLIFEKK